MSRAVSLTKVTHEAIQRARRKMAQETGIPEQSLTYSVVILRYMKV